MGVDLPIHILFCLSLQLFQESTSYQHSRLVINTVD